MDFVPIAVAAAMVTAGAALVKDVLGGQVRKAVTFLMVYVVALGVTFALAASDFAAAVSVADLTLETMNVASKLLVAFAIMSMARIFYEAKTAVDGSTSAAETKLNIS